MAEKYYSVKVGRQIGIYRTWDECKEQVVGYKGALYKSFSTRKEAEQYVLGKTNFQQALDIEEIEDDEMNKNGKHYDIYVDGSYNDRYQKYSWSFVVYHNGIVVHKAKGIGDNQDSVSSRNVAGELEATMEAVKWAKNQDKDTVTIHHDYLGISEWAKGNWQSNLDLTKRYASFMKPCLSWLDFKKVAGHTGVEGNVLADKLAGEALKEYIIKIEEKKFT